MYDLKQLLGFPFKDRDWFMKIILGSIISIVPIINFLSLGYFIRCIRCGWKGLLVLPDWDDWGDLFREGCTAFLVLLIYLILPVLLAVLLLAVPVVGMILACLAAFIMCIFIPMAIANYAVHRDMREALLLVNIFQQVGRVLGLYIIGYITASLGLIIGTALLIGIPFFGFIGGLLIFYCGAIFFNYLGFLYREAI